MLTNKNQLLPILIVLLLVKFVFVPIIDWQNEKLIQIKNMESKLNKSIFVSKRLPQLNFAIEESQKHLDELKKNIDVYTDISTYQLEKQRFIEQLFKKYKIKIKTFNWRDAVETQKGMQVKLMMQYSGNVKDFMLLHLELSQLNNSQFIKNLGLNIRQFDEKTMGTFNGNMVIVFEPVNSNKVA